jgi:hypothetical protein
MHVNTPLTDVIRERDALVIGAVVDCGVASND